MWWRCGWAPGRGQKAIQLQTRPLRRSPSAGGRKARRLPPPSMPSPTLITGAKEPSRLSPYPPPLIHHRPLSQRQATAPPRHPCRHLRQPANRQRGGPLLPRGPGTESSGRPRDTATHFQRRSTPKRFSQFQPPNIPSFDLTPFAQGSECNQVQAGFDRSVKGFFSYGNGIRGLFYSHSYLPHTPAPTILGGEINRHVVT